MHQHRARVTAGNRPGLDPRGHLPAPAVPVALGAGPVIAASPAALASASAGWLAAGSGAVAAAGVLFAFAAGGAGVLSGSGASAVAGGRVCAGVAGVAGQGAGGEQHAVLLDQLGDPGPGHAQLAADLGVGQALSCPGAGLPQPGGAEDRRAAHLVDQAPGAVLAVAGADPRHLRGLDAERGGDGLALEAAAFGERADRQVPHLQVAGTEGRQQHRAGVHRDRAAVAGAGDGQWPGQRHAGELLSAHPVSILLEDHNPLIFRPL